MQRTILTLPNGSTTYDKEIHQAEWRIFSDPLLRVTKAIWIGVGHSENFDFIQIEYEGVVIGLTKKFVIKLVEIIEG